MNVKDELIRPDFIHVDICSIDFAVHKNSGYSNVIIDADGTLTERKSRSVKADIVRWLFYHQRRRNITKICIVSNVGVSLLGGELRIAKLAKDIDAEYVCAYWRPNFLPTLPNKPRLKPSPEPYITAMKKMGSCPNNTIVIGDQLYTDILGGNLLRLRTIWICKPFGHDHFITRHKRHKEQLAITRLRLNLPS